MAEISRRAGVGMATLTATSPAAESSSRPSTPTRSTPSARPPRPSAARRPERSSLAWLHRFFAFATSKHHIASELLEHTDRSNPVFDSNRARVIAAGRPLLAAAQHAREVRDDLTLEQILDMVIAIATIHGDTRYLEPILQTALDGLRPQADVKPA